MVAIVVAKSMDSSFIVATRSCKCATCVAASVSSSGMAAEPADTDPRADGCYAATSRLRGSDRNGEIVQRGWLGSDRDQRASVVRSAVEKKKAISSRAVSVASEP